MHSSKRLQIYTRLRRLRQQIRVFGPDLLFCDPMDWKVLREESELDQILKESESRPQVIFKHSTRCSISSVAKSRLDRAQAPPGADFYYLDILSFRSISNKVAAVLNIHHESPQVLIIRNRECVYDESHMGINMGEISDFVDSIKD